MPETVKPSRMPASYLNASETTSVLQSDEELKKVGATGTSSSSKSTNELKKYSWDEIGKHRACNDCWMVVKGKVYDVSSWVPKHPGGKLILNGAGREATGLFLSYHPLHVQKYLPNYLIGEVEDYNPYYSWENEFYPVLKSRVEAFLKAKGIRNNSFLMYFKTALVLLFWSLAYYLTIVQGYWWFALVLGVIHAHFGITIAHDGNHGAYSQHPWLNTLAASTMDFMGASSIVWLHQHNIGHHPNSNRQGSERFDADEVDPDARSGTPLVRLTPSQPWLWYHRWQHIYIWILFAFVSFKWGVNDVKAFSKKQYATIDFFEITTMDILSLALFKTLFLSYIFFIPWYLHSLAYAVVVFMLFMIMSSYVLVLMFSVNHLTEEAEFPSDTTNCRDWAQLQCQTSTNFAVGSTLWTWLSGGLNYQVEHHLFPSLCHVYLPQISPIVQQTCREYHVPYFNHSSYWDALFSHYTHLKQLGNPDHEKCKKDN